MYTRAGQLGNNRSDPSHPVVNAHIPPNHHIANHTTYFSQSRPMAIPGCFRQKMRSAWCLAMTCCWLCGIVGVDVWVSEVSDEESLGMEACGQPKQSK